MLHRLLWSFPPDLFRRALFKVWWSGSSNDLQCILSVYVFNSCPSATVLSLICLAYLLSLVSSFCLTEYSANEISGILMTELGDHLNGGWKSDCLSLQRVIKAQVCHWGDSAFSIVCSERLYNNSQRWEKQTFGIWKRNLRWRRRFFIFFCHWVSSHLF